MKPARIWIYRIIVILIIIGAPFFLLGGGRFIDPGFDAVSSATVISEGEFASSEEFVVIVNDDIRKAPGNSNLWVSFFEGGPAPQIFEDIFVLIPGGDEAGDEYCAFLTGRLPVNQMTYRSEDALLVFSKLKYKKFDIIIMSAALFDNYGGQDITNDLTGIKVTRIS